MVLSEDYAIDLLRIAKILWRRIWLLILAAVLSGGIGLAVSAFLITPTYSSSIMLYVNNSSFSLGNTSFSISPSEINAAQSLVKTYGVILDNRTTLERIIEKANVPYTYEELSDMIYAASLYMAQNSLSLRIIEVKNNDALNDARKSYLRTG